MTLRIHRVVVMATVVLVSSAPAASAGSLRATGDGFRYSSDAAVQVDAYEEGGELVVTDAAALAFDRALPDGCVAEPVHAGIGARCTAPGERELRIVAGDGNSRIAAVDLARRFSLDVRLGTGDNVVEGGAGDDRIVGGDGRDTLYGGPGDDLVVGGDGNDYVRGNGGSDVVRGGEGINFVFGDGGDDVLRGGSGIEYFTGGRGNDVIHAGGGSDDIGAGAGDDEVYGGDGDDELRGGAGVDRLVGGAGDDLLRARDGEGDQLDCGAGADVARLDAGDVDEARRSCEKVRYADAAMPADPIDHDVVD